LLAPSSDFKLICRSWACKFDLHLHMHCPCNHCHWLHHECSQAPILITCTPIPPHLALSTSRYHIHTYTHIYTQAYSTSHPLLHHTLLGLHHSHCLALRIIHPPHHHNITIISTTTASFIIVWRLPSLSFHLAPQAASNTIAQRNILPTGDYTVIRWCQVGTQTWMTGCIAYALLQCVC
jgi:hypothetical protein